jgi:hypothetical protein
MPVKNKKPASKKVTKSTKKAVVVSSGRSLSVFSGRFAPLIFVVVFGLVGGLVALIISHAAAKGGVVH